MASQLYKMLNNIDKDRIECIKKLKNAGFEIKENASLRDIGLCLENLPSDNNRLMQFHEDLVELDPETSNEVWQRPSDWPDMVSILQNAEDIEENGRTYFPYMALLLDNSQPKSRFVTSTNNSTGTDIINFVYTGYSSYNFYRKIKTSENTIISLSKDVPTGEYVWNPDLDINGKYRWIILYVNGDNMTTNAAVQRYLRYNEINYINAIEVISNNAFIADNRESSNTMRTYMVESIQQIAPTTPMGIQMFNLSKNSRWYIPGCPTVKHINIHYICADKIGIQVRGSYQNLFPLLTTLKIDQNCYGLSDYSKAFESLVYVTGLAAKYFYENGFNNGGNSIKFATFDREEFKPLCINDRALQHKKRLESTFPDSITTLGECAMQYALTNIKYLDLSNVTNITGAAAIEYVGAQIIDLRNLKTLDHQLGILTYPTQLILDSLETATTILFLGDSVTKLELPALKTFTATELVSKSSFSKITKITLPALEVCSYPGTILNDVPTLKYLELPKNYTFNFNFSGCISLTKNTLLDILDKAADVTGSEEPHTLTLGAPLLARLTDEEKSIITNKGWVLK